MNNLSQFLGGGRIKSIQRGTIALPTPEFSSSYTPYIVQINEVNTSKSILYHLGTKNGASTFRIVNSFGQGSAYSFSVLAMIELTSSTTISATIGFHLGNNTFNSSTIPPEISWQLVEYY
jgi:hypothetical protein